MKLWICNRQRCDNCIDECKHTSDKAYAADPDNTNFVADSNGDEWQQWTTQANAG